MGAQSLWAGTSAAPTGLHLLSVPLPIGHPLERALDPSWLWARFQDFAPPPRDRAEASATQSVPPGSSLRALHAVHHLIARSQLISPNRGTGSLSANGSFARKRESSLQTFRNVLSRAWIPVGLRGMTSDSQDFSWQMAPLPSNDYGNEHAHRQARKNLTHRFALRIVKCLSGVQDIHCK